MWALIEVALLKGLRPLLDGVRVAAEVPPKVETLLPVFVVRIAGGGDDRISDTVIVDTEAFGADRAAMWEIAERGRAAVHALAATMAGGVVIDTVDTDQRPIEVPYGNPAVRRAIATYRLTTRARTGP
ncbi:hypothetical protein [Streptomyces luteogriseus]|uniref:hypothetical protein n=1 Tax=Streptomyces luteogriseus TaxID=68233 RepID=UPI00380D811A